MPRRDERGAILPMVALMLVALIGSAAFAVDLGMQRVARRDMQALADAVALDLARLLDGRTAGVVRSGDGNRPSLEVARVRSTDRNDEHTLGGAPTVAARLVELDAAGAVVMAGGAPKTVADAEVPDGVLVTATTAVDFGFAGGEGGAVRTALAVTQPFACFSLGSYALAVDPTNPADTGSARLDEMLEDALQVTGLGYHGLADATVSLAGLAAELGAFTPDQLMAVRNLRLRDLFSAMAVVLGREGGSSADVTLLETLAGRANAELDGRVDLAELVGVTSDSSAVLGTEVRVLDLLSAAAFASDGSHALDVPVLWSVPKFSSGTTSLTVVQRPQGACGAPGEATAQTAQLTFTAQPVLHVGNVAGLSGNDPVVQLEVNLAGATGALSAVQCGQATPTSRESVTVDVDRSLSSASLTIPIRLTGDVKASDVVVDPALFGLLSLLPSTKATFDLEITLSSTVTGAAGSSPGVYEVPERTYVDPQPVGDGSPVAVPDPVVSAPAFTGTVTVNSQTRDVATLVGQGALDLTPFVTSLQSSVIDAGVGPFLDNVNAVLTPTAEVLGVRVAGADLYGWPRPTCDVPALRG